MRKTDVLQGEHYALYTGWDRPGIIISERAVRVEVTEKKISALNSRPAVRVRFLQDAQRSPFRCGQDEQQEVACERLLCPWVDHEQRMRVRVAVADSGQGRRRLRGPYPRSHDATEDYLELSLSLGAREEEPLLNLSTLRVSSVSLTGTVPTSELPELLPELQRLAVEDIGWQLRGNSEFGAETVQLHLSGRESAGLQRLRATAAAWPQLELELTLAGQLGALEWLEQQDREHGRESGGLQALLQG